MIKSNKYFLNSLKKTNEETRAHLRKLLPQSNDIKITKAMNYAVLNGGKGLRAFLALETSTICGAPKFQALQAAAAIECIHCYSLVHDDLPAMDNDDLRRGKPTVHKRWDDATAILVGDALQSLAFEILSHDATNPDAGIQLNLIKSLALASGVHGMVGGQALDIEAETSSKKFTVEEIIKLQNLKTGALITWAAEVGARLTNQDLQPFTKYAASVGLAFQIQDDILDIIGDKKQAGKALRKDIRAGKATFVSLLGLDGAKIKAEQLISQAYEAVDELGDKANQLRELAKFVVNRAF
mgnify:CR=1 FL=1